MKEHATMGPTADCRLPTVLDRGRSLLSVEAMNQQCPRALVEASHCLKLEFDVWQQNDAAEFATKLLDRLELSLKKWSPSHFKYLTHKFGLKTTKQKICKECGLKVSFVLNFNLIPQILFTGYSF